MKCEECEYYDEEFNGKECCGYEAIIYSGCVEAIPEKRVCKDFKLRKTKDVRRK